MHVYTVNCMIIRWRERSSDRHGGYVNASEI